MVAHSAWNAEASSPDIAKMIARKGGNGTGVPYSVADLETISKEIEDLNERLVSFIVEVTPASHF